ncbi:uncharacterized protein LOC144094183 [Amblyomma americanum]
MPGCCAFGCSNRTESGMTFFSIPTGKNDRKRRSAWLHRIGRENFKPTKNTGVCEDHFCAEDFEKARVDGKKRLKHKAVPSIFSHRVPKKIRNPPFARLPNSPANNLAEEQAEPEEENLLIAADSIADGLKSSKEPHDHDESADVATEVPITSDIQEDAPPNMFSEVDVLKRQLNLERRKRTRAEMECDALRSSFNGLLAEDQLLVLQKGTMSGSSWTQKTIQESLKVRLACGGRGYEYLRGNGWPLPAERTLQKHIEDIKFTPGMQQCLQLYNNIFQIAGATQDKLLTSPMIT